MSHYHSDLHLRIAACLLLATSAATSSADDASPPNLILNGSFESASHNTVAHWNPQAWAGQSYAQWSVATPGRTDTHCVSIASQQGSDVAWSTTVATTPHAWYELSGWIKTEQVEGAAGCLLNIQNMQQVRTPAVTGTHDWTRVVVEFQSVASELEINCLFGGWGTSTGKAWFDDVQLRRVDPQEPSADDLWASVKINDSAPLRAYDRMIFGGFLEHFGRQIYGGVFEPGSPLADADGFRTDVIAALKELKTPVVRWPGGCYVSGYHWAAGVGDDRRPTDDMAWGVIESNAFGTDEFVKLSRLANWQPYICTNAGNGSVEEMANWVAYCNAADGSLARMRIANGNASPFNVNYWSIGNENWGEHEIGYKPIEQWAPFVLASAKAMKAVDPSIRLSAAAVPTREWALPLLQTAGDYLDLISLHGYWLPLWQENHAPSYLACMMQSEGPEETLDRFVDVLEESGYRGKIKIAFDEWNLRGWHHPGFPRKAVQDYADPEVARLVAARNDNSIHSQYTMADALFSACFLNACLRHAEDVAMANIAPLVNTRGPLYVHPRGIVRRTHFHTLCLYANELESHVVDLSIAGGRLRNGAQSVPIVDAVATAAPDKSKLSLILVNRHPAAALPCTVRWGDELLDGDFPASRLAGDAPDAFNDVEHPERVKPERTTLRFTSGVVELPPHSLNIVHVALK
ncbi:MAG: hypothetical protein KDA61_17365 [Planctomycetales bacterium]|nr:hypothetical protein [Planctomycetales bacterium]